MKNPIKTIIKEYKRRGIKNLYFEKNFFDKEATILEFLSLCPDEVKTYDRYDDLFNDALAHVGYVSFDEKTKDFDSFFYLLSNQDKLSAIALGVLAYYIAKEIDEKGQDIEKAIDKLVAAITGDANYDINNPFDVKTGKGHRMFGHDPLTFAFKNIPSDYLISVRNDVAPRTRKVIRVGDFLGVGKDVKNVSMLDIVWKFYGNESSIFKGIMNSIGHIIVHFAKDLFTPDGLPIPFTSLLEKFVEYENPKAHVLAYRESFYKSSQGAHLKASDFTSLAIIELFAKIYCESSKVDKGLVTGFKDDFKMIAITTCVVVQTACSMVNISSQNNKNEPSKILDGVKVNVPLLTCYLNVLRRQVVSIYRANKRIDAFYKEQSYE